MSFYEELKKRKVIRVVVAYAIVGWAIYQIVREVREPLQLPEWTDAFVLIILLTGFPIAVILAWAYQINRESTTADETQPASLVFGPGVVLGIVGALALGVSLGLLWNRPPSCPPGYQPIGDRCEALPPRLDASARLPLQLPDFVDSSAFAPSNLALSTDGRQIAYVGYDGASVHLYLKGVDDNEARKMPDTEGASSPAFSPNGREVAFFAEGWLKRLSVNGGQPVSIARAPGVPRGASWGDDNNIVFTTGFSSPLLRVPIDGGDVENVTEYVYQDGRHEGHRFPDVLPGTNAVVFMVFAADKDVEIWVKDFRTGQQSRLIEGYVPRYANGKLVFMRDDGRDGDALWSVDFDVDTLTTRGQARPLNAPSVDQFDLSDVGGLIWSRSRPILGHTLVLVDNSGNETELLQDRQAILSPTFSPDEKYLLVRRRIQDQSNLWLFNLMEGHSLSQLTFDGALDMAWWTDSTRLAYAKYGEGIVSAALESPSETRLLDSFAGRTGPVQWWDDGLLFYRVNPGTQGDLYFKRNEQPIVTINEDEYILFGSTLSPNRKWLATTIVESGEPEVFVQSFPNGGQRYPLPIRGAAWPRWSADDDQIKLYILQYEKLMVVDVTLNSTPSFGVPEQVDRVSASLAPTNRPFDVSPAGQIAIAETEYGEMPPLVYVTDWQKSLLAE